MQKALVNILNKVKPVAITYLADKRYMLFGSGGFAKKIYEYNPQNVLGFIDYTVSGIVNVRNEVPVFVPEQAKGIVVLGTGNGSFQFNQLNALAPFAHNIEQVLLVDPYIDTRHIDVAPPEKTVLMLEHADGVKRHARHLTGIKEYLTKQGLTVTSICPNTLFYYKEYWQSRDIVIWGGQRPLYQIAQSVFSERAKTYVEYGFFPQSEHIYLDKLGVNQNCSLMFDDLTWVEDRHYQALNNLKASYLADFKHKTADYVLVPLQVPDDANIINCSRFTKGMQEFIDYVVDYYPKNYKLLFKAHPKDPFRSQYHYHGHPSSELPFLTLLENAKHVHGITSSCLYEASLAGLDVITEGTSLLSVHKGNYEGLFAAMVDRQVEIKNEDIADYVMKYSSIGSFM
ncbi:capsular polysaccharide export protein, LipB/KpsS family [Algibacillus agarilyticus]|uniref:capsular polysaccharide export protein, LipB/KpsS family n=1 Tax=Algibacillus agarilyticus TaxID=2234133 RepID=UPI000DCFCE7A|nr:hypothetical protein [Algibacillus agarilyticus]